MRMAWFTLGSWSAKTGRVMSTAALAAVRWTSTDVTARTVKVWLAWAFLLASIAGTVLDFATNRTEPFHVLMLSWLALDISAVQVLVAVMTHRDVQEQDGE
jgi:hypothetical protein